VQYIQSSVLQEQGHEFCFFEEFEILDASALFFLQIFQLWMFFNALGFFKKVSVILWPHTTAITKPSVSIINNLRCGNSVCLCSMDFVSGSNTQSKKKQFTAGTDSMSTARDKL